VERGQRPVRQSRAVIRRSNIERGGFAKGLLPKRELLALFFGRGRKAGEPLVAQSLVQQGPGIVRKERRGLLVMQKRLAVVAGLLLARCTHLTPEKYVSLAEDHRPVERIHR